MRDRTWLVAIQAGVSIDRRRLRPARDHRRMGVALPRDRGAGGVWLGLLPGGAADTMNTANTANTADRVTSPPQCEA